MAAEVARYWRHRAVDGVDLLRARYVTHRYGRHAHETYTFGVIEAGVEEFEYGGSLLRAGVGDVALLDPDIVHTGQAGTPEAGATGCCTRRSALSPRSPPSSAGRQARRDSRRRFCTTRWRLPWSAARTGQPSTATTSLPRRCCGRRLLPCCARTRPAALRPVLVRAPGPGPRAPAAVATVSDLLHERLADPPTLAELAAMTELSQFALLRAFRAEMGLPPHAYLNQLRVRRARLLLDDGVPAADVAAQVGFADQAHLTRHFKRVVGVPPAAYQRERLLVAS